MNTRVSSPRILLFFLQVKEHIWQRKLFFSLCLMLSLPIKIIWGPKAYLVITSTLLARHAAFL